MTTGHDWVILDTNVWIFGLRNQSEYPSCIHILRQLPSLFVKVPRQILLELRANLTKTEMADFFHLISRRPDRIEYSWERVELTKIQQYQQMGCKLGDAAVAAHAETLEVKTLVSENRDFLTEIKGLPFRVLTAEQFLQEHGKRPQ